jgi:hypothetical protein
MKEIEFYTRVGVPTMPFGIDYATGIVSLGSCFSDEIGKRLQEGDFHIEQNPFGTLYNPASIASALRRIMYDREIGLEDLVEHEGLWHSWHHHGSFSRATAEECLEACNSRIHQAHEALKQASLLMITFGSAWIYEREGQVVANCHKLPQENFVRRKMSVEDIVSLWRPLLKELYSFHPHLSTLFTVSPIRHIGDGLHGNQLSKSTLLLAIDELVDSELPPAKRKKKGAKVEEPDHPVTVYFPAYEIVVDELRDYRFYEADMVHPSTLAVDVVWDRFQRVTMVPAIREQAHFNAKQHKREKHITINERTVR